MTKSKPVRILMSAINGYGYFYLKTLREEIPDSEANLVGVVDPDAKKSGHYPWIEDKMIPVFDRMDDFFRDGRSADLTVISSPPQYHVSQSITALRNGSNVLVDKPAGVGEGSVKELISASERYQRWVEVGYQWSFSEAIQILKRDILDGRYGRPVRFKTICLWPRDNTYYGRNSWAGRIEDPNGRLVLDSPANNACAHFLHNILFLGGDKPDSSAIPVRVECSKYRAYDIQSFDTISCKAETGNDIEIYFYASHVSKGNRNPEFVLEFTGGNVRYNSSEEGVIGKTHDGNIKKYGSPDDDHQFKKLFHAIELCRKVGDLICPPEAAIAQTICIDMIQSDRKEIMNINPDLIVDDGERRWVEGLNEIFDKAYDLGIMLSNYEL